MLGPWVPSNPVTHMPSLGPRPHGPMAPCLTGGDEDQEKCQGVLILHGLSASVYISARLTQVTTYNIE